MVKSHTMTPGRRAALRKAQLASARKRRRGGVGSAAKRAVRQRSQYTRASASVASRRVVKKKGFKGKAKKAAKKAVKYTAVGLGAAAVGTGALYGGVAYTKLRAESPQAKRRTIVKHTTIGLSGAAQRSAGRAASKANTNTKRKIRKFKKKPAVKHNGGGPTFKPGSTSFKQHQKIKRASIQGRHPVGKAGYTRIHGKTPGKRRAYGRY